MMSGECDKCGEHALECGCLNPIDAGEIMIEWKKWPENKPNRLASFLIVFNYMNERIISMSEYSPIEECFGVMPTHWMELPELPYEYHNCKKFYGNIHYICTEANGKFIFDKSGAIITFVNYCPICGEKAPKGIDE